MVENTAKFGGGAVIKKHYFDFVKKEYKDDNEKEDSDSIIATVIARGGLKIKK